MSRLLCIGMAMLFWGACSEIAKTSSPMKLSSGKVDRISDFSSRFVSPRTVDVWLPDGYAEQEQYAVLYMHDGQMLFDSSTTWNHQEWGLDEAMGALVKAGTIEHTIVVGIAHTDLRHSEYFPQKPFESLDSLFQDSLLHQVRRYGNNPLFAAPVCSDNYLRFITQELKPYIDSLYPTRPDRDHTFIAGSSMGGLISMYALCEYPDVFGGAACLSTHWPGTFYTEGNPIPGAFMDYLSQNLPSPSDHKLYFDYGTETLDSMYAPFQRMADSICVKHGFAAPNWASRKFEGHDHSENSWRERIAIPLAFLLGE